MAAQEKTVTLFTTRVRQMMLEYEKCKSDNQSLRATIATLNERIEVLENQLREAEKNYNSMKTAKMLEVTDGDMDAAKARLAKLIRSVNKCITLLSEK